MTCRFVSVRRINQIEEILTDLDILKNSASRNELYAINANIEFFESTKSVWTYVKWLLFQIRKLNPERLLEINELLPKYDEDMHARLMAVERKKIPGLIEPLISKIIDFIVRADKDLIICDLGFGGMEVERQVIDRLHKANFMHHILFVGFDISVKAIDIAENNLRSLNHKDLAILRMNSDDVDFVHQLDQLKTKNKYTVVLCSGDVFSLHKIVPLKFFNLVFSCFFCHHLSKDQGELLEWICPKISNEVLEYDGYRSLLRTIPQSIESWAYPILLNATIFSNIRFPTKAEMKHKSKKIRFSKIGTYLLWSNG